MWEWWLRRQSESKLSRGDSLRICNDRSWCYNYSKHGKLWRTIWIGRVHMKDQHQRRRSRKTDVKYIHAGTSRVVPSWHSNLLPEKLRKPKSYKNKLSSLKLTLTTVVLLCKIWKSLRPLELFLGFVHQSCRYSPRVFLVASFIIFLPVYLRFVNRKKICLRVSSSIVEPSVHLFPHL